MCGRRAPRAGVKECSLKKHALSNGERQEDCKIREEEVGPVD